MKYPLPRKIKKELKNGDCAKRILFEVILEEKGPESSVKLLKQWGARSSKEVFDRELYEITRTEGLSVREKKRVYQYATPAVISRTSYPNMRSLAMEALKFAKQNDEKKR